MTAAKKKSGKSTQFNISSPQFRNETLARKHLESTRWPDGPICPHCGSIDRASQIKAQTKDAGARDGLWFCNECREQFTVTVGTVMEASHIPLHKWLLAIHLMAASKKGVSAAQIQRTLGLGSYRTAWFLMHRIREAMTELNPSPMGGEGKTVEADETYHGDRETPIIGKGRRGLPFTKRGRSGSGAKRAVFALVERGGEARMFHVQHATAKNLREIMTKNVSRKSTLYTDESSLYTRTGSEFATHDTVHHSSGEYVRGIVHTNTVENVFSVFKRGMTGVYQFCSEAHLPRYLNEFSFRYSNRSALGIEDAERANMIIAGTTGKRLTYRRTGEAKNA